MSHPGPESAGLRPSSQISSFLQLSNALPFQERFPGGSLDEGLHSSHLGPVSVDFCTRSQILADRRDALLYQGRQALLNPRMQEELLNLERLPGGGYHGGPHSSHSGPVPVGLSSRSRNSGSPLPREVLLNQRPNTTSLPLGHCPLLLRLHLGCPLALTPRRRFSHALRARPPYPGPTASTFRIEVEFGRWAVRFGQGPGWARSLEIRK